MSDKSFPQSVHGLAEVEQLIREKFTSDAPRLSEVSAYLFNLGGKRIRPMISLTLGQALGISSSNTQLLTISAGIELIHLATLLHDDIIDKAPTRRHKPSAYVTFGSDDTLIAGDFLLSRAFGLCSTLPADIVRETERACVELTEGEILEVPLYKQACTTEQYLIIAQKKTASLFRLACYAAASLAGLSENEKVIISLAGEKLGIAFQVIDDILDVISDEATLGKRQGQDIREQKPSIVNLFWLEEKSEHSKSLKEKNFNLSDDFISVALQDIINGSALSKAKDLAQQLVHEAKSLLYTSASFIKVSGTKEGQFLEFLMQYALERVK